MMRNLPLSKVYRLLEPGPVVLLTTAHKGRSNVMTMSLHMMVEFEPPLVACVVINADYSFAALRATKQCVVAIPGRGTVPMKTELIIRFDYGSSIPWVRRTDAGDLLAISGPDMLVLRTPVELRGERLTTVGQFAVSAGQTIPFVLMHAPSHLPAPDPVDAQDALRRTQEFWEQWASTHKSTDMYADSVSRSLITLKALTFAPTGGIVAAAGHVVDAAEARG
jgi:GH15 family glucan-1,4-alpha-glucosidase